MHQWKNALKQSFTAPTPLRKSAFLHELPRPKMPTHQFLFSQISYIGKWSWCISILVFSFSIFIAAYLPGDIVWILSAFTPFLALTLISETGRSEVYKMVELEMVTAFSHKSILLARLGILGVSHLILLCILIPIGIMNSLYSPIATGLYIMTPFLLTTFIGLRLERTLRGHEAMYAYLGITAFVSLAVLISHFNFPNLFDESYTPYWTIGTVLLCLGIENQYLSIINRTEAFTWNSL